MSRPDDGRAKYFTVRAEPALRGIMSRLATIGLTALETWSASDIPNEDQREAGRDVFKCILDTLAWESQKRDWKCAYPESALDVSRETTTEEEEVDDDGE